MLQAEEENDVKAARMAGAEKVAEMAEFDEQFISQHQNTDNDVSKKRDHVHSTYTCRV